MEYGAIDLHLRRSVVRILNEDESVVLDRRIDTTRVDLDRVFAGRARMRILIESSTESEWVAQHLEALDHAVIVADPNYLPMYGGRTRKVKTDRRDVAALAIACRRGLYRAAHRASAAARTLRQTMRVRRHVVQTRSGLISLLRAVLRQEGLRLPSGSAERVLARLDQVPVPATLVPVLAPIRAVLQQLTTTLRAADEAVEARATHDAEAQRLMTAPGVGPVLALTFQGVMDTPTRFGGDAARASAFVGLVPSEDSSAERQRQGHITKCGPGDLRALLVQASWSLWRGRSAAGAPLRTWAQTLAARRGRRIAIVALARRLTRILYAMWRDQREFGAPRRVAGAPAAA
jgi:transposase